MNITKLDAKAEGQAGTMTGEDIELAVNTVIDELAPLERFKTTTSTTAGIEAGQDSELSIENTSDSNKIFLGRRSKITYAATANSVGAQGGHLVSGIDWMVVNAPSQTVNLAIAGEAKLENIAGTTNIMVGYQSQLTQNHDTIGLLVLHDSLVVSNEGTVGSTIGYRATVEGNAGTMSDFTAYAMPDLSAVIPNTKRRYLQNHDAGAPSYVASQIVTEARTIVVPSSGDTVVLPVGGYELLILPAETLAALAIQLPDVADLDDGYEVLIKMSFGVTTPTFTSAGATFMDAPTELADFSVTRLRLSKGLSFWYVI